MHMEGFFNDKERLYSYKRRTLRLTVSCFGVKSRSMEVRLYILELTINKMKMMRRVSLELQASLLACLGKTWEKLWKNHDNFIIGCDFNFSGLD